MMLAGAIACYALLSMVPLLILLATLLSFSALAQIFAQRRLLFKRHAMVSAVRPYAFELALGPVYGSLTTAVVALICM